jgi:hypothetical protein
MQSHVKVMNAKRNVGQKYDCHSWLCVAEAVYRNPTEDLCTLKMIQKANAVIENLVSNDLGHCC